MSPVEIAHRVGDVWTIRSMRHGYERGADQDAQYDGSQFAFCNAPTQQLPELAWDFRLSSKEAADLYSGSRSAAGLASIRESGASNWHRAPDTGRLWPQEFFGRIPYRVGNPYGDIRIAWEPARLQRLVELALLAKAGEAAEGGSVELLESILASWIEANPPLTGIHYISAMECAIRLIAVCYAVDIVRNRLTKPERTWRHVLQIVSSHAPLIARRLSLFSSAGNHTIAEAVGLVHAGTLFPEFPKARAWKAVGLQLLEQEAARQILADGGGIEQAFWYQLFVVDLLGLTKALLQHHAESVPRSISNAVERGRRFLNVLAGRPERLPAIGDSDSGYALSRHLQISWHESAPPRMGRITIPDAGYTVIRGDAPSLFRLVFDHGPFGMPPSYGHAHADALSVCLTVKGRDLLIDPGTFTYTGEQVWRRWFRGTSAHNTVTVDGQDQARQESAFQWSDVPTARLIRSEDENGQVVRLLACHPGYKRIGVIHWRGIVSLGGGCLLVWDYLTGKGRRLADLHWHLAGEPQPVSGGFIVEKDGAMCNLSLLGGAVTVHRGELDPPLGWQSSAYGVRAPGTTIKVRREGALPHEFLTYVDLDGTATPHSEDIDREIARLRHWVRESKLLS